MEKWQDPTTLTTWILIIVVLVIGLLVIIGIYYKTYLNKLIEANDAMNVLKLNHQVELSKASLNILESERSRIALEIHDGLINKLNALLFLPIEDKSFNRVKLLTSECIQVARKMSHELLPPMFETSTIQELIYQITMPFKSNYELKYHIKVKKEIAPDIKLHLIRIIQEAITNITKHASASSIEINLKSALEYCYLSVVDDGIGFSCQSIQPGLGLQNIELRTQVLGGKFKIKNIHNKGTRLVVYFKMT